MRHRPAGRRTATAIVFCAALLGMSGALGTDGLGQGTPAADVTKRVTERLAALNDEAEALAGREKTLLNELRQLEIERQIKTEEVAAMDEALATVRRELAQATNRIVALGTAAGSQQPDVEDRLVRLYKMGQAGYWRLLLDVRDLQAMGRAYRTAAALTRLDRDRVRQHGQTMDALKAGRAAIETRLRRIAELQTRSATARAALERAVTSRRALIASVESRRDLAAQLAAELDAAHLRLQATLAQSTDGAATFTVPLRPFRGELPWPADGIVTGRFGRQQAGRVAGIDFSRHGIELSLAEGQPVTAVHEGVVTHSGPFTGFGQLVIVDHGGGASSLYGHLSALIVTKGDRVSAGSRVGLSGRNPGGNPSVYFELRIDGKAVDPLQWLRAQP